ncbi:hypothetical protein [Brevibacillus invocatus]|uniref:hypothetical protein n=1 Tax=Brevibacillus invocatus TaxID=173959 RepID=UPI00204235AA|nr:hypothetical protein [Brevibacillus invocatus]MCM3081924.1 hypothetical protein [Brevibacillus invocatus]MCM3432330.1 hypothetical protein [Brevibacillus invocatus]
MAIEQENLPVYDERVNEILRGLTEGKTREELAERYEYSDYRSLDMYMRRRNFTWDRQRLNYVPAHSRLDGQDLDLLVSESSKAAQVISLFKKEGADAKTISKRLGFGDHRELAAYMKGKGYVWSADKSNYIKQMGVQQELTACNEGNDDTNEHAYSSLNTTMSELPGLAHFLPILEMLDRNRDRLVDLLTPASETGNIPRYVIPGVFVTKSVHMTNTLDQLVRDFSREKNVSQRDIFVVALVEFFRRYGYEREMETLLGQR